MSFAAARAFLPAASSAIAIERIMYRLQVNNVLVPGGHQTTTGTAADIFRSNLQEAMQVGFDINTQDPRSGNTLLHCAVKDPALTRNSEEFESAIQTILQHNPTLDVYNSAGYTPLHLAAVYANEDVLAMLLKAGASVDKPTREGQTALMLVCKRVNPQPRPNGCDIYEDLAHENRKAAQESFALKVLKAAGANPELKDPSGRTAKNYLEDATRSLQSRDIYGIWQRFKL